MRPPESTAELGGSSVEDRVAGFFFEERL